MPRVGETCAGKAHAIGDETEITQSFEPVVPPAGPPPAGPPRDRRLAAWLALLGLLVVGGLLAWAFGVGRSGSRPRTAPRVVGLQQRPAVRRLTQAGYGVLVVVGASARPRGTVVSEAVAGNRATLHVSNGRPVVAATTRAATTHQATTTAAPAVAVPGVVGQDMASGAGQIEAAGFVAETEPVSASRPAGQIAAESPAAGTEAAPGSTVVLQVATGSSRPPVQAPNVLGQQAAAARAALLGATLTVRTEYRTVPKRYVGVVVQQAPAGGASVAAYTQATVVVGR